MPDTRTNQQWLDDLTAGGDAQEAAITDLRDILLRAALFTVSRSRGELGGLGRAEILHLAEDCAQDALIAVMDRLAEFRGDSKFTTWAYKFAVNIALTAARRERWKGVSLDDLLESAEDGAPDWMMRDKSTELPPERSALRAELRRTIQTVIQHDLTDRQRQVLTLMVYREVPMDEVVRHLGTNRNSVYKLLHDARRKLKSSLQARGFEVGETLTLFDTRG